MNKAIGVIGLALCSAVAVTSAGAAQKACEDLKTEIGAKLMSRGVTSFSLDIVPTDSHSDGKVIGDCERGTKKITYKKVRLISS